MRRTSIQIIVFLWLIIWLIPFSALRAQIFPANVYDSLFFEVQLKPVFDDSKKFPDLIPYFPPEEIMRAYVLRKENNELQLSDFVADNFDTSFNEYAVELDTTESLVARIETLWPVLLSSDSNITNTSLIPLPNPYIRPGGRFREVYYWDTYFTMLGLKESGRDSLIVSMLDNFAYLIDQYGFVPNANRTYYLSRSQPPFFAEMLKLPGRDSTLLHYLPYLIKEYEFWMQGSSKLNQSMQDTLRVVLLDSAEILNRYYDNISAPRTESYREDFLLSSKAGNPQQLYKNIRAAAESGWDFSGRWFEDKKTFMKISTTEILPVDLNALMYNLEKTIAGAYRLQGNDSLANNYEHLAKKRKRLINKYFWNEDLSYYFDYHFGNTVQTGVYSLAGVYPLFFEIADSVKAGNIKDILKNKFLFPGGLVSTLNETGQQWDFPNGWAPLQWMAVKGLMNYGYDSLAMEISSRWLDLNEKIYRNTGRIVEKYNVVDTTLFGGGGEYPLQDGFGWTNGVYLKLRSLQKEKKNDTKTAVKQEDTKAPPD